uniref:Cobyrinic acid a,c-diamide synthase (CobB-cbiA) n=2 Tax=environmental samples TaxID=651140 RepID=A0A075HQZ0_9ARCH|nr:cobyrinic acid a,c-diamide synthase (cobB-cbiA) [uncultured marine thaumarchaeote KM3_154_A05]AIF17885.1 cobyrinic acid a,c-diamide synthase (cobB-cbiA) [uncultured marine thaumarchaeote KM3_79_E03]
MQPFKVGPDYIDPSYLSAISGNDTRNLDVWLMGENELVQSFVKNSASDVSIIEGVMGYYDGFGGKTNYASTHHVASLLKSPTVLVLDASKAARSIAATALGFAKFHRNSRIIGIILNKIGSKKHENMCRQALANLKVPILGSILKNSESMESRHLGLIPVKEQKSLQNKIRKISREISDSLNIAQIIQVCKNVPQLPKVQSKKFKKPTVTVAVALDSSFNFYYHDNLEALRREGARIKFFSPVSDKKIPRCDLIYIGGGFPEVLGNSLEKNSIMRKLIKKHAEDGMPIYAECGGLMYLTKSIIFGKRKYKMVGLFDAETQMTEKMTLNYTEGRISSSCLVSAPAKFHAHEFHYSKIRNLPRDAKLVYDLKIGEGIAGKKDALTEYNTLASYCHLYFDSAKYAVKLVQNSA